MDHTYHILEKYIMYRVKYLTSGIVDTIDIDSQAIQMYPL